MNVTWQHYEVVVLDRYQQLLLHHQNNTCQLSVIWPSQNLSINQNKSTYINNIHTSMSVYYDRGSSCIYIFLRVLRQTFFYLYVWKRSKNCPWQSFTNFNSNIDLKRSNQSLNKYLRFDWPICWFEFVFNSVNARFGFLYLGVWASLFPATLNP